MLANRENARQDRNLVRIFCSVAFKTAKAKRRHRDALNELRDKSQQTIFAIDCFTSKKTRVQATKAARDKIDDSFWDNPELALDRSRGNEKLAEYDRKADEHIAELVKLMDDLSTPRRLELLPSKKVQKQLPSG